MTVTLKNLITLSALALIASLTLGCATTQDLENVRQEALSCCNETRDTANRAMQTANEALAVANDAKARSIATDERINRMFKRSMLK